MEEIRQHELMLTQYFIDGILNLDPEEKFLRIIGKKNIENRCAVVSVQTLHMDMAQAAFELDSTYGIMTRVGLHCAPNAHKTLGTYPEGTLRFSFGPENTKQELDIAFRCIIRITITILVYQQVDFLNNLTSKFLISALSSVAVATATPLSSALK